MPTTAPPAAHVSEGGNAVGVVTPPKLQRGPSGSRLDAAYVKSIADLFPNLGPGEFVSTGKTFEDKSKARKHTDRVKGALVDAGAATSTKNVASRLWQPEAGEGLPWVAAVGIRTPGDE